MRIRAITVSFLIAVASAAAGAGAAQASSATSQVRAVYQTVLTAEYFGPASGVCSHLTSSGVKSFTAGGKGTCSHAFSLQQHVLKNKTKGVDDSGYTANQWRSRVKSIMAHLKVEVQGSNAIAVGGQSGIPGETLLVKVKGKWLFSSYPPSVQS